MVAPNIEEDGDNSGRQSTCLKEILSSDINQDGDDHLLTNEHRKYSLTDRMAIGIVNRLAKWIVSSDCANDVVKDFSKRADWTTQYLREGKVEVIPERINIDGTLQVIVFSKWLHVTKIIFIFEFYHGVRP